MVGLFDPFQKGKIFGFLFGPTGPTTELAQKPKPKIGLNVIGLISIGRVRSGRLLNPS